MYARTYKFDRLLPGFFFAVMVYSLSIALNAQITYSYANSIVQKPTENGSPQHQSTTIYSDSMASSSVLKSNENLPFSLKNENTLAMITPTVTPSIEQIEGSWKQYIKQKYPGKQTKEIKNGVVHTNMKKWTKVGYVNVNVVEVNRRLNNSIVVQPALSSTGIHNKSSLRTIAVNNGSIMAINGSFFKPTTGTPLGILMINNELITGPIFNRVALGIGSDEFIIGKPQLDLKLKYGSSEIKIDNINQPRMLSTYTLIYSNKWGSISPSTPKYGIQIAIKDNVVVEKSRNPIRIPQNGYVIVGPEKNLGHIPVNAKVELTLKLDSEWSNVNHIISGGPYLVKDGKTYIDVTEQKLTSITGRNPRTAVGYTKDHNLVIVTVDGRQENSSGMTLSELASLMKELGCVNAINLDGGGSTQMYLNGRIVNNPSNRGGTPVSNALILK